MMKTSIKFLLLTSLALLPAGLGCSRQQLTQADQLFGQGKALGERLQEAAHDPLIPEPVQIGLEAAGVLLVGAYGLWQRVRAGKLLEKHDQVSTALKAVVDGVERAGAKADPVKAQIGDVMQIRGIYETADPVIEAAKTKIS